MVRSAIFCRIVPDIVVVHVLYTVEAKLYRLTEQVCGPFPLCASPEGTTAQVHFASRYGSQSVRTTLVTRLHTQQFGACRNGNAATPVGCVSLRIFLEIALIQQQFEPGFPHSVHVFCVFSCCVKQNPLLDAFALIRKFGHFRVKLRRQFLEEL